MKTAIGGLGWRPADFWLATVTEYFAAVDGHNEANGAEETNGAPTPNEMAALTAKYG
jgi:hypothetical protein